MDIQKYQRINQSDDNKLKNNKIATYKNNKFRQFDIKKMKQNKKCYQPRNNISKFNY